MMDRRWLVVEALFLSLPAALLILEGLPFAGYALLELFSGETDVGGMIDCVLQLLPYAGGLYALLLVWQMTLRVAVGQRVGLGIGSVVAAAAALVACLDTESVASAGLRLLVSLPVWLLAMHVCLLGTPQQRQTGPQLE